ncbi:hypothetical protein [Thermococcus sp.]|uniref:hypothetical protein n=1 Tax=Thermococcus sp. TaxID=35749 RepID=UPI00261ECC83|nr:hypothetical protein [Thermococcus sp.]
MKNKPEKAISFIEGFFVTSNPWLAIIAGAMASLTRRENRYYSKEETSIAFLIGTLSGFLCGLVGFRGSYFQWWNPYSKGILSSLIGVKLWIPAVMIGLALREILRGPKDEDEKRG